jgi:inorganic pyrophosphatase
MAVIKVKPVGVLFMKDGLEADPKILVYPADSFDQ